MADLTTLAKAKAQLGLTEVADMDLEILTTLVTSSSAWVERQLGRPVLSASYTETKDGDGGTRMFLNKCPATDDSPPISVTSVTVDGVAIPSRPAVSTSDTNPSGWVLRDYHVDLVGYTFTKGTANVTIAYTVGYTTCPEDLEQAVLEHVAFKYRRRTNLGSGSSSVAGDSVSYTDAGVIAGINDTLDRYRALGVA